MNSALKKMSSVLLAVMMAVTFVPVSLMAQTDEASAATTPKVPRVTSDETTWDCVFFGSYPQSLDWNGGYKNEPIKWRVLSVNGNEALLLADKIIDSGIPYNEEYTSITWENCTMRSWLNNTFMDTAFTSSERQAINSKTIVNSANPEYGTEGGNNTTDKVFLLSIDEVTNPSYGFSSLYDSHESREAVNTAYTASKPYRHSAGRTDSWWLRSPGSYTDNAADVRADGYVSRHGYSVGDDDYGVRPALYLNLSSSIWESAGTVSSDGNGEEGNEGPESHIHAWKWVIDKAAGNLVNGKKHQECSCGEVCNENTVIAGYSTSYVKSFKVSKGKKSFTAKWKKQSKKNQKKFNGYQIRYSTKSDMSGAKTITVSKSSKSKKVRKLKAKKKYYVQVRTYTKKNGSTFYSKWSSKKAVKTKK